MHVFKKICALRIFLSVEDINQKLRCPNFSDTCLIDLNVRKKKLTLMSVGMSVALALKEMVVRPDLVCTARLVRRAVPPEVVKRVHIAIANIFF